MLKKLLYRMSTVVIAAAMVLTALLYTVPVAADCGGTKTQLISCDSGKAGVGTINSLISIAISVLSVLIGIVAVGGIAYAAIIYASARDDQSKVSEARVLIRNIIIGLLLYSFTIAIINWLIPGGVIG